MEVIGVRHAITVYNEQRLINGVHDEPLSPAGLAQIPLLIKQLGGHAFNIVYCSSLQRSRDTAEPVAEHFGVPLMEDDRIIEVNFGSFAGRGWDSTIPYFGLNSSGLLNTYAYDLRPFGGERAQDTRDRVQSFMNDLKERSAQRPLLICHGGILRWLYRLYSEDHLEHIANATIHRFTL